MSNSIAIEYREIIPAFIETKEIINVWSIKIKIL